MSKNFEIQLHAGQLEVFNDPHKIRVLCCGRRWGKSKLMIYSLVLASLGFEGKTDLTSPQVVAGIMPTYSQAKRILFQPLVNLLTETNLSKYVKNINKTSGRISFENGKPDILIAGANDNQGAALRGSRFYWVGCDEYADFTRGVLDAVLLPACADTPGSRLLITSTPKGKLNEFYEIFNRQDKLPDIYKSWNRPTVDNPTIDPAEVEIARSTLPPKLFQQEFFATFESSESQVFTELDEDNRCDKLPDSFDHTILGVDWGERSPAIICLGKLNDKWYYVDGWAGTGDTVVPNEYVEAKLVDMASRWHPVATFCDASRPSSVLSVRNLGKKFGLLGLGQAVSGFNRIEEGINQVHTLVFQKRLLFPLSNEAKPGHTSAEQAYLQMAAYHYALDKDGNITNKIADGQNDHLACDALRYALARKEGTPR